MSVGGSFAGISMQNGKVRCVSNVLARTHRVQQIPAPLGRPDVNRTLTNQFSPCLAGRERLGLGHLHT